MSDTPLTDTETFALPMPEGEISQRYVQAAFARKLERWGNDVRATAAENIRELNDRLIERQESFQAQLIRIEDTWREKLKEKDKEIQLLKFKIGFL